MTQYLPTVYEQFIHISRYSRWLDDKNRRETWEETVKRYCDFFSKRFDGKFDDVIYNEIQPSILKCESLPSMRAMMTAGVALERDNIGGYNCAYVAVSSKRNFSEILYILMNGTGCGFSCERQEVVNLPTIPNKLTKNGDVIVVDDSKLGWAKAYNKLINSLYDGDIPEFDYSKVRPAGARLKTFGGRASGPKPLKKLFDYTIEAFKKAAGRKLQSIEVHDIVCTIAETIVVGGVRRSALLSLSNLSDQRMRDAKSGQWWIEHPERALANNSIAYTEKPEPEIFLEEWLSLVKSKSGERGIFNRVAAQKQAAKFGKRDPNLSYGANPCNEIILRPNGQFCNLTTIIVRENDNEESLKSKARIAAIMGTMQASLTDFSFVSESWKRNTIEEALLGVSMTGISDNKLTSGQEGVEKLSGVLNRVRDYVVEVNLEWASKIGIKPAAASTCIKPEGTVSQLVNSASGIHTRHSAYYLRTVRTDKKDPIYAFMKSKGVYCEDDVMKPETGAVFYFPIKSPEGCLVSNSLTAIQQLELWLVYQREWCSHKPSVTISVADDEWIEVGAWVYKNFDELSGVSFIPRIGHSYQQAPYQEITEQEYHDWLKEHPMPGIDWLELSEFEKEDCTESTQTLACVAGVCEL